MTSGSAAPLTARRLNGATLDRQLLLRRAPLDAVTAVRRIVAVQAQQAASPYLALWSRVASFDPAELEVAFADHAIVKAPLMRITLHAVHADDYPAFHGAMVWSLRASRLNDARFRGTGLTVADADALLPHVTAFAGQPRTNAEFEALLEERLGVLPKPGPWWALRTFASLVHAPTGGPWSFGTRPSYVVPRTEPSSAERDASVRRLARRYLEGFGPASAPDLAQFTMLTRAVAREALHAQADELVRWEGPDGVELFDVPGAPLPDEDTTAPPRLMAMWDSTLLAYADRSRIIPPGYRKVVTRNNGDVLPTLLVDGYVAGVWRPVEGGIEATAFHRLSREAWQGLAAEAQALVAFLAGREPTVYSRYGHWWKTLPAGEVRILPG